MTERLTQAAVNIRGEKQETGADRLAWRASPVEVLLKHALMLGVAEFVDGDT